MTAAVKLATAANALRLAEEWGYPVFPVKLIPKPDGKTDKKPMTANGFKDASTNIEQIARWWQMWPDAVVGVPTGRHTKLLLVDIDPDGDEWFRDNAARLECGRTHRTGRGWHLVYSMPDGVDISNSAGKVAKGVDVRGTGGFMVWWPASGGEAVGDIEDIKPAPAWLIKAITESGKATVTPISAGGTGMVGAGRRNDFLSREAFRQKKMGATHDQIVAVLTALNDARCEPPVDADEILTIVRGKAAVAPDVTVDNVEALPWQARLRKNDKGKVIADEANMHIAMRHAPELAGVVQYNEFSRDCEFRRTPPWRQVQLGEKWTDNDDTRLLEWMQLNGVAIRSKSSVADAVQMCGDEHKTHPVRDYLHGLEWDGIARLDTWLAKYLGAAGSHEYLEAVGRRWPISAVARIMRPGCQADHTLVLEGLQGAGKSRTARALAVNPSWFVDRIPDLHTADAAAQLAGRWIVEVAELAAIRHTSSIESAKAFLTRTYDVYRPSYGRRAVSFARQCVFIGSTNEDTYLKDKTGNRRYWPVKCGAIAIKALEADIGQLWAEAFHAYIANEPWHLDADQQKAAAVEQDDRVMVTELEQQVGDYLDRQLLSKVMEVEMRRVLVDGLNLDPDKPDYAERCGRLAVQAAAAMRSQGWHRVGVRGRGKGRRNIYRYQPEDASP